MALSEYRYKPKDPPSKIKYRAGLVLSHSLRKWLDGEMDKRNVKERKIRKS